MNTQLELFRMFVWNCFSREVVSNHFSQKWPFYREWRKEACSFLRIRSQNNDSNELIASFSLKYCGFCLINTAGNHFFFIIWIKKDEFFIWEGWGFKRCASLDVILVAVITSFNKCYTWLPHRRLFSVGIYRSQLWNRTCVESMGLVYPVTLGFASW